MKKSPKKSKTVFATRSIITNGQTHCSFVVPSKKTSAASLKANVMHSQQPKSAKDVDKTQR
jgi:hypothetical protein